MKNNISEIVFILDRSGSMCGLENDTIGGFNSMIEKQKVQSGRCYVSTFLFDNDFDIVHDRVLLGDVKPMTQKDYFVRGSTALIDAMGHAIDHISKIHKYARPEDVPENTIFVITTDGMENSSCKYSSDEVKNMVNEKKKNNGWEFIFLGANIDAIETAKRFGIAPERAVNYHADPMGTDCLYATVSEAVQNVRRGKGIAGNWSEKLNDDYEKRKR